MTGHPAPMRADAQRNRVRVLEAAEEVLARDGRSASMRAIAEQAGVGLGTLYRHFPNRRALHEAIVIDRGRRLLATAEALATADDPGPALFGYLTRFCETTAQNKMLTEMLDVPDAGYPVGTNEFEDIKYGIRGAVETLLARARRSGAIRPELAAPEVLFVMKGLCLAVADEEDDPELRAKALAVVFDGLRARST
ncbi:TetR/AcrR family transcriptional regulator [Nocardia transvalensis]|uniref:TetR/AcrR family transcriptional regulator n=1 Tax=Nocardia transvalensis TaxID=37333 RepID=UPI001895BF66|nr:TetR/AcrR family transcriptional regulator [Nocardia transvalensis]MBF6327700.1 TetR/AcrR family transcriptional regulator [Nocardia transvalensis]